MNGSVLLDTNIIVKYFRGDELIGQKLDEASEVLLSMFVVGELVYGARVSAKPIQNLQKIYEFAAKYEMLPADLTTAEEYGVVKSGLSKKGTLIPDNDIWIAAQALQFGLKVVTGDSHFNHVDGLAVEAW